MTASSNPGTAPELGDASPAVELIFLGTGTSASLPQIECLTAPPDQPPCHTCLSTLRPEGKKNIRRNTSAVFRVKDKNGKQITVVCDVGKNFQAAAVEWFPKYGLRHIDAVLITHPHADAMNGLDDLRAWTLRSAVQPHIDLYVSENTFTEVRRAFPYLVSKEFASGGGDVPEFKWHIIEDKCPFEIEDTGVWVTPFAVHHGRYFSIPPAPPPPGFLPTPAYTSPSTPVSGQSSDNNSSLVVAGTSPVTKALEGPTKIHPYISYGYKIAESVIYISDVSYVPEDTWSLLEAPKQSDPNHSYPVFVVDCLRFNAHTSHFGLRESVNAVKRLGAKRNYLTGFGHEVAHDEYLAILESIGQSRDQAQPISAIIDNAKVQHGRGLLGDVNGLWVRPAFDGLRILVGEDGSVSDAEY